MKSAALASADIGDKSAYESVREQMNIGIALLICLEKMDKELDPDAFRFISLRQLLYEGRKKLIIADIKSIVEKTLKCDLLSKCKDKIGLKLEYRKLEDRTVNRNRMIFILLINKFTNNNANIIARTLKLSQSYIWDLKRIGSDKLKTDDGFRKKYLMCEKQVLRYARDLRKYVDN